MSQRLLLALATATVAGTVSAAMCGVTAVAFLLAFWSESTMVVFAGHRLGDLPPELVSSPEPASVSALRSGSMIVDIAVDQGGLSAQPQLMDGIGVRQV